MMSEDADVTPRCSSTKQVIIGQRVTVIPSGDGPLALSIAAQGLDMWSQYVPPTFASQCCWPVFLESHVLTRLYLHLCFHNKWRLCSNQQAFAPGRKHPCVSDWVYEPCQQWRMNSLHTWIRTEKLSYVCGFFSTAAQIQVSCSSYKMFWNHKVIQPTDSELLIQWKHNKVGIALVMLYQD